MLRRALGHSTLAGLSWCIGILACTVVAATVIRPPGPRLIWNASASMPIGLYVLEARPAIARGDIVAAALAPDEAELADRRRYLPRGVPVIKRAAGIPGDLVCAARSEVTVNGTVAALRQQADGQGRALPFWEGCLVLDRQTYLLLGEGARSFDSRYFGPVEADRFLGRARRLWP